MYISVAVSVGVNFCHRYYIHDTQVCVSRNSKHGVIFWYGRDVFIIFNLCYNAKNTHIFSVAKLRIFLNIIGINSFSKKSTIKKSLIRLSCDSLATLVVVSVTLHPLRSFSKVALTPIADSRPAKNSATFRLLFGPDWSSCRNLQTKVMWSISME